MSADVNDRLWRCFYAIRACADSAESGLDGVCEADLERRSRAMDRVDGLISAMEMLAALGADIASEARDGVIAPPRSLGGSKWTHNGTRPARPGRAVLCPKKRKARADLGIRAGPRGRS